MFFSLIALFLLGLLGWLGYDAWVLPQPSPLGPGVRGDLLRDPEGGSAQVLYQYRFAEPVYSHELDTQGIQALRRSDPSSEGAKVRGLTVADFGMESLYRFQVRRRWLRGGYLAWVEDLKVDFSYRDVKVFVTRDYLEGSCEYNVTRWHEDQHVRIHREVHGKYQPLLESEVAASKTIPLRSAPVTASSREEGKRLVGERISSVLDQVFERFNEELQAEQAKIDSGSSYDELRSRCSGW